MTRPLRIVQIEDSPDDADLVAFRLRSCFPDAEFLRVETPEGLAQALAAGVDVVLADHGVPRLGPLPARTMLMRAGLDVPFIVVSGGPALMEMVRAWKTGAHDCVGKDDLGRLASVIERELAAAASRRLVRAGGRLLPGGTFLADAAGVVLAMERSVCEAFGLTEGGGRGQDARVLLGIPLEALTGRGPQRLEGRRADGLPVALEVTVETMALSNRRLSHVTVRPLVATPAD